MVKIGIFVYSFTLFTSLHNVHHYQAIVIIYIICLLNIHVYHAIKHCSWHPSLSLGPRSFVSLSFILNFLAFMFVISSKIDISLLRYIDKKFRFQSNFFKRNSTSSNIFVILNLYPIALAPVS